MCAKWLAQDIQPVCAKGLNNNWVVLFFIAYICEKYFVSCLKGTAGRRGLTGLFIHNTCLLNTNFSNFYEREKNE